MWSKELVKNKVVALLIILGGIAVTTIEDDITVLCIGVVIALLMFFSPLDWFM